MRAAADPGTATGPGAGRGPAPSGIGRRDLLGLAAVTPLAAWLGLGGAGRATAATSVSAPAHVPPGPVGPAGLGTEPGPGIVKPVSPAFFTLRETNAETNWPALRGTGRLTPVDRFFVRNHTGTPRIDARTWRLTVRGSGLRGGPVAFGYDDLLAMPSVSRAAFIECAGNGRVHYPNQQGEQVRGTPWGLGGIGTARWRGVPLGEVLRRAGLSRGAVDVMPSGLDDAYVHAGRSLGRVRRPMPVAKALDDVLLAYEMNGEPLPCDHGFPVRVVVPNWVGIASIKWVGDIEVSAEPLSSPWSTDLYRLYGPAHPEGGSDPLTRQSVKSAFELAEGATLAAGRVHRITGRSWSGAGGIRRVEISTDGGAHWQDARLHDAPQYGVWSRWSTHWRPPGPGPAVLMARATDTAGRTQPDRAVFNTHGYLFDAVVRHAVTVE
ncbi:molybdopterin-dependent oxidoreductase [Streptomyces sp. URMC 123]|uniref:sulfite oxidase n=1 Tax=Streptomyces sp. URMC 123 TaxID=3423403 RepID=UPI003F1BCE14